MLTCEYNHVSSVNQDDLSLANQQLILQALSSIPIQFNQKERALQQENQKLKTQLNKLEDKQQELINEIQDLKILLKRVYQEGEIQLKYQKQKNQSLEYQNESLSKALVNLQNNIENFAQLKELSNLFEEQNEEKQN